MRINFKDIPRTRSSRNNLMDLTKEECLEIEKTFAIRKEIENEFVREIQELKDMEQATLFAPEKEKITQIKVKHSEILSKIQNRQEEAMTKILEQHAQQILDLLNSQKQLIERLQEQQNEFQEDLKGDQQAELNYLKKEQIDLIDKIKNDSSIDHEDWRQHIWKSKQLLHNRQANEQIHFSKEFRDLLNKIVKTQHADLENLVLDQEIQINSLQAKEKMVNRIIVREQLKTIDKLQRKIRRSIPIPFYNKKRIPVWLGTGLGVVISLNLLFFVILPAQVIEDAPNFKTSFIMEGIKGDTIETWALWGLDEGEVFHIHVLQNEFSTPERVNALEDVILSSEVVEIDNSLLRKGPEATSSTYYSGWGGALNSISEISRYGIPKNLHIHTANEPVGRVIVEFTEKIHPNGYSGFTKIVADEVNHEMLKAYVTVYNVNSLTAEELSTVLRHELGHVFGLTNSAAPEDLKAPIIGKEVPLISQCDIDALIALYNGSTKSEVICLN